MKNAALTPQLINSISEMHRLLGLPKPLHPLVSMVKFEDISERVTQASHSIIINFYMIAIKRDFKSKLKYGQHYYDFDEGIMSFIAPGQLIAESNPDENPVKGWMLIIHPDFIRGYQLAKTIKNYGFFSYQINEALHLSEKEEGMMEGIVLNIQQEYSSATDLFSQDLIISHIELLLNYANRFYNRQFITRKQGNNSLLLNIDELLSAYIDSDKIQVMGLPTVQYLADQLHVSPGYLSDMLRVLTGQNTQQHIHHKLIEKAKEILTTSDISVSEVAYRLGFEYPQYFSKLFKSKTKVTPLQFRQSFN